MNSEVKIFEILSPNTLLAVFHTSLALCYANLSSVPNINSFCLPVFFLVFFSGLFASRPCDLLIFVHRAIYIRIRLFAWQPYLVVMHKAIIWYLHVSPLRATAEINNTKVCGVTYFRFYDLNLITCKNNSLFISCSERTLMCQLRK
jgi:hypothetical protein